ncbi:hypothetical protein HKX48_004635 [Thoreauomyces humboldtii]|nr:hypothetical protein HKX48_004635 [Thoreauomyces humboldtii]
MWRKKVHASGSEFLSFCEATKSVPAVSRLAHWANWITPIAQKSRFNTQFFMTVLDTPLGEATGQECEAVATVDGIEAVSLDWLTPKEAIQAFDDGRISLFIPQYYSLLELSRLKLADLRAYVNGGRSRDAQDLVESLPEPARLPDGSTAMVLPGDCLHSSSTGHQDVHRVLVTRKGGQFTSMQVLREVAGKPNSRL